MKLGHIEIFVQDPMRSKQFYQDVLGFELVDVQQDQFVWLQMGQQEILLRPGKAMNASANYESAAIGLVLYTEDVAESAAQLQSRGLALHCDDQDHGCYSFTDLDGNWFQLVDPSHH